MDWRQRVSGILDERVPPKHRNRVPGFIIEEGSYVTEEPEVSLEPEESEVIEEGDGGGEFCTGYRDKTGSYHEGFQCPLSMSDGSETEEVYCCGTAIEKFCCDQPGSTFGPAHIGAIVGGLFGVLIIAAVIVILCCCFCSCCCVNKRRRRSPRRRGHRPLPTHREGIPSHSQPTPIPMTTTNGHTNGKYLKQVPTMPPPVPSQPPPQMQPSAGYPSPMQGYPQGQQPAYAPQMAPEHMSYNPHVQQPSMMMNYGAQQYTPQPMQQYPPQQFGAPLPEPPPYSAQAQGEAPPLQDKGMAYPPSATRGPSAPPPH